MHLKKADDAFYRSDHPDAKLSERVRCKADWIGLSLAGGAIFSVVILFGLCDYIKVYQLL